MFLHLVQRHTRWPTITFEDKGVDDITTEWRTRGSLTIDVADEVAGKPTIFACGSISEKIDDEVLKFGNSPVSGIDVEKEISGGLLLCKLLVTRRNGRKVFTVEPVDKEVEDSRILSIKEEGRDRFISRRWTDSGSKPGIRLQKTRVNEIAFLLRPSPNFDYVPGECSAYLYQRSVSRLAL